MWNLRSNAAVRLILHTLHLLISLAAARDVLPQHEKYLPDPAIYHNLKSLGEELHLLASLHPEFIKLSDYPHSRKGAPQYLIRVSNFTGPPSKAVGSDKTLVLFSFGEHAREWFPTEVLIALLRNITNGTTKPLQSSEYVLSQRILSTTELYIVGMMNPDGRQYVEDSGNYCWRGTSTGVDLNRNFGWEFGGPGSSDMAHDEEYRGTHAFSEPETKVLVDLTAHHNFDAFVSFHSGIRQIYTPFADTASRQHQRQPDNLSAMLEVARLMTEAATPHFRYGPAAKLNDYAADGTVFDYMAGVRQVPVSLAVELWGEGDMGRQTCFDLFNPPSQLLHKSTEEVLPLIYKLITTVDERRGTKEQPHSLPEMQGEEEDRAPSLGLGYLLVFVLVTFCILGTMQNRLPAGVRGCRILTWFPHSMRLSPKRRIVSLSSLSSTFSTSFYAKGH